MSELVTGQIFTDGQKGINAGNMNGIVGLAKLQPDAIGNKPASATMNVADTLLVLKTDNTLAQARFDTIVNSTASALPVADATKNGMMRQLSGNATDYVGGDNQCHVLIPPGVVWDYAGATPPSGWLLCNGTSYPTATYPNLFAAIGYAFGGSGANFNVPDARGRATIGAGTGAGLTNRVLGTKYGAETVALTLANMVNHTHSIADVQHNHADAGHAHTYLQSASGGPQAQAGSGQWAVQQTGANTGVSGCGLGAAFSGISATQGVAGATAAAFGIMNPSIAMNRIIKT